MGGHEGLKIIVWKFSLNKPSLQTIVLINDRNKKLMIANSFFDESP